MSIERRAAGLLACALALGGCGGGATSSAPHSAAARRAPGHLKQGHSAPHPHPPTPPPYPRLLRAATRSGPTNFVPAGSWQGRPAVWIARRPGVVLLSFDQRLVGLQLHSGTVDAGPHGWRYGPRVAGAERRHLMAAFNSGFKLDTNSGGFASGGRTAVALSDGLGSIVTYANGTTDIGAWHRGLPASGQSVTSVRQNLHLLISGGRPAPNLGCRTCWGATLGGTQTPARSALGITADARLIWVGGENLTVGALAGALLAAHVRRAVELDINPEWVAAYLYGHRRGHGPLAPVPMVPGQPGIPGEFLTPYSRDFFTVVTR
ncbi:MAG: hypothetical protein M3016_09460 [Actinomycetota bacterium]|nr:hypothetical protein [Actinomycetota bacterium]